MGKPLPAFQTHDLQMTAVNNLVPQVLSTLVGSGFTADALGTENVSKMADYLEARLEENNGITGFGRGFSSLH